MASFGSLLALLAAGAAAMLLVLAWTLRRALRPLQSLRAAIDRIAGGDTAAARSLPAMPIRELQSVRDAVAALAGALDVAQARRRDLARRMLTLQEDERSWLARELHDEFGQRLTALRLEASILQRTAGAGDDADPDGAAGATATFATQLAALQRDLRGVISRLAPRGGGAADAAWLSAMLGELAATWVRAGGPRVSVDCELAQPIAPELALALYRISQEALTNVARHAGATNAWLAIRGDAAGIAWSVRDDGRGIADPAAAPARGNGLAGIRQRVFAFGGDLEIGVADPGTWLRARLHHPGP
jgi:two-component system sensor histidine kinase UhpB